MENEINKNLEQTIKTNLTNFILSDQREKLYADLEERTLNQPLVKYEGDVPNGNEIWIKRQCDNQFESHYDKPYIDLFKHYELEGKIKPGDKVFETTSGSAGRSFAGIGKILGYECHVALPAGGEKAREEGILAQGAKLYLTKKEDYVNGFPMFIKRFLIKHRDVFFINHSMGEEQGLVNKIVLDSFGVLAKECILEQDFDYFVPANGNGSSLYGAGKEFDPDKTKVLTFESFQSAMIYDLLNPGLYEQLYGIEPGTLSRHKMPGTSYRTKTKFIDFPHTKKAVDSGLVEKVYLVSDKSVDAEYFRLTGRTDTSDLPHWDKTSYDDVGRSTLAGIEVCKEHSKSTKGKKYLIIGYDKSDKYDS